MKKALLLFTIIFSSLIGFGQSVRIGDILCTDGSTISAADFPSSGRTAEGIVFYVDNTGTHGWAVSLNVDALDTDWVTNAHYYDEYDIPDLLNCENSRQALYDMNGYQNTAIIHASHGPDWYPAAWAVDFDNGWYLPAAGQMRWLLSYVNEINESLSVVNGTPFVLPYPDWHWTSTECSSMHAVIVSRLGTISIYMKWNYYSTYTIGVRAIKDFECNSSPEHKIGDVITAPGGQTGIVFYVSPDDGSYWLTALSDLPERYSWGNDEDIPELDNIVDEMGQWYGMQGIYCGYDATKHIRDAQGNNNAYAANHIDFENGWHIPSTGQLSKIYAALPHIEEALLENGGSLPSGDLYWTSTENSSDKAWAIDFGSNEHLYQEGRFVATTKETQCKVRPVWSQNCETVNMPTVGNITAPEAICADESLILQIPESQYANVQGWQISPTIDFNNPIPYDGEPLESSYNGWYLRYFAANENSTVYSNVVTITVWPNCETSFNIMACTHYVWNNIDYNESGDYEQHLFSIHGCDSIVTLHLTIADIVMNEWWQQTCNEPFTWNGTTYTATGDYEQTFISSDNCDSIVTLHLVVFDTYDIAIDSTVCGSFMWNGQEYTQSGLYEQQFVTAGGCDSLVRMDLTVLPFPEAVPEIIGLTEVYVSTNIIFGQYNYSIDSVEFATHYEWILEGLDWIMDTTGTHCTLWVTLPGTATLKVRAWNSCGYSEQQIVIRAGFFDVDENQSFPVVMYPNPAQDKVCIEAKNILKIKLFNWQGQVLRELSGHKANKVEISLTNYASAIYFVEILTEHGIARLKLDITR